MLSKYFNKLIFLKLPARLSICRSNCTNSTLSGHNPNQKIQVVKKQTKVMDQVTNVRYGPLPPDSPYVRPFRLYFDQNGKEKNWDILKVHDSVSIVLYHTTRRSLIFVKQFRPAVYHAILTKNGGELDNLTAASETPPSDAITLELCAGIVDKPIPMVEIAVEEVLEECGYNVSANRMEEVMTYRAGVGTNGSLQTMYYCEVSDADKVTKGGGVEDEMIDVVEYTLDKARDLVKQGTTSNSPPSFLFGVLWFLTSKAPALQ